MLIRPNHHEDSFWIVWNPVGRNPSFRHDSQAAALNEAKRLAAENPGHEFYVLEAQAMARRVEPVEITAFTQVPF